MKIKVRCDCGKTLVAAGELAGKKTKCPACGAVLRLPLLDEASEQPASFLLTETGLSLTDDPQEVCAAPGEEMPPTFNFSETEHTPDTSPECESSHRDSDTSKPMKEKPGRELSTIPKLWAWWWASVAEAFMVFDQRTGSRQPSTNFEDPVDLRGVRKIMADVNVGDDRDRERWFWTGAAYGVIVVMGVGWWLANNEYHSLVGRKYSQNYERFKSDFAPGATANAVERIADTLAEFDQGAALMRCCSVALLWLILLALLRINGAIESQTKRLLSSAERENQPPPK